MPTQLPVEELPDDERDEEPEEWAFRQRRLSRQERLEAAADAGHDTWEEYRGER